MRCGSGSRTISIGLHRSSQFCFHKNQLLKSREMLVFVSEKERELKIDGKRAVPCSTQLNSALNKRQCICTIGKENEKRCERLSVQPADFDQCFNSISGSFFSVCFPVYPNTSRDCVHSRWLNRRNFSLCSKLGMSRLARKKFHLDKRACLRFTLRNSSSVNLHTAVERFALNLHNFCSAVSCQHRNVTAREAFSVETSKIVARTRENPRLTSRIARQIFVVNFPPIMTIWLFSFQFPPLVVYPLFTFA